MVSACAAPDLPPGGGDPSDIHHHCLDYCFIYVAPGRLLGSHRARIGAHSPQQPHSTAPSLYATRPADPNLNPNPHPHPNPNLAPNQAGCSARMRTARSACSIRSMKTKSKMIVEQRSVVIRQNKRLSMAKSASILVSQRRIGHYLLALTETASKRNKLRTAVAVLFSWVFRQDYVIDVVCPSYLSYLSYPS